MTTSLRFDRNSIRQITRDLIYLRNMKNLLEKGFLAELEENLDGWIGELKALKEKRRKQALDKGK